MITDIEEELKVKLLLRSTRQVALTESGQEYARQLEAILWRINKLQANITAISTAPQGPAARAFAHDVRPGRVAEPWSRRSASSTRRSTSNSR